MGAPKPGSTFQPTPPQGGKGGGRPMPPQGGKGAVQPQRPPNTYPGMPLTPNPSSPFYFPNGPEASAQALNQGKGQGVPMGGMLGGGGNPMQPQVQQPYTPIGYPPVQQPGQVPAQGGKGNMPLPADYQSRYGNYGFDSGLQNYLDQQYVGSTRDAGVGYQYDPSTQTFTGGTMAGQYNPIPLSVMQQAAAGNRDVLNPYFQSKFPQQPAPQRDLGYGIPPPRPQVSPPQGIRFPSDFTPPAPGQTYINPNINPAGFTGTLPPRLQQPAPVMPRPAPQVMPRPVPQVMPRGLAGLRGRR
jgi:hypothetical protein